MSPSAKKAEAEGLKVMGIAEAAAWADLIMFTMPDELQADTYKRYVHDHLREGAAMRSKRTLNPWANASALPSTRLPAMCSS